MAELLLQYNINYKTCELTGWRSQFTGNYIMMLSDCCGSEINFYQEQVDNLLQLLCNIRFATNEGVDFATSEEYNEDEDEYTGEYYWDDGLLYDGRINPYFEPDDGVYGTWCSSETIDIFIAMLRQYINNDIDDMENLDMYGTRRLIAIHNEVVYG